MKKVSASPMRPAARTSADSQRSSDSFKDFTEYRPQRNFRRERSQGLGTQKRQAKILKESEKTVPKVRSADLRKSGIRVEYDDGWVAETVRREVRGRGRGGDVFMRFRAPRAPIFGNVVAVLELLRQQAAEGQSATWLERKGAPRDLKVRLSSMKRLVSKSLRLQLELEREEGATKTDTSVPMYNG